MSKKPVLVIMAAGMGSRYGGLKQIDPVDPEGHIIMDFSLYDARLAGFEEVIFIIKRENEEIFRETVGNRAEKTMKVSYVFQELQDIPEGFAVPENRKKPWGTGHAVLSCRNIIDGPFAVINADDYYGRKAFSLIYDFLSTHSDTDVYQYAMVSYILNNTLTEHGHVARGICEVDGDGKLVGITERTHIVRTADGAAYLEEDGCTWKELDPSVPVSMNMWGFTKSMIAELETGFRDFLEKNITGSGSADPAKCEFYLPFAVDKLLHEKKAVVQVLGSTERWYGVTYHEDKQMVMDAVQAMKEEGKYPDRF